MAEKKRLDLARLGAWLQTRWDRFSAKHLTVGSAFRLTFTLAALFVLIAWPIIRSEHLDWRSWGGWGRAVYLGAIPLVATVYLKYSEGMKRARIWDKLQRKKRTSRQLITGLAIKDLAVTTAKGSPVSAAEINGVRERILQAAALGVEELLGFGDKRIVATLLEFKGPDTSKMTCSCRSTKERQVGVEYPTDEMIAWHAIKAARITIVDDIATDVRCSNWRGKSYRSIAAVPVGYGGKAFGAISLDHEDAYAFYGRAVDIALQLEPYAATLALTYGPEAVYHACQYDPSSTG